MSLDDLPTIQEAIKLEKSKFHDLVRAFLPYSSYCSSYILPEKLQDWCTYLQCNGTVCAKDIVKQLTQTTKPPTKINNCRLNKSNHPILNFNGSCFDDYICIPVWASKDYHYTIGIFGFILAMISIFLSILYVKGLIKEFGIHHTASLMLVAAAICDIIYLSIKSLGLFTIFTYYTNLEDQLYLYSFFHIYIIRYLLPLAQVAESLSLWILVLLTFDRFNNLRHGNHSKNILTKNVFVIFLCCFTTALLGFMILKFLMFELIELPHIPNHYKLVLSKLAKDPYFDDLTNFWLKMPLEGLLPLSSVFIFVAIIIHQMIFGGRLNRNREVDYQTFTELRLTKSIMFIGIFLLIAYVPKMTLHIMRKEIGISGSSEVKFDLFCGIIQMIYYCIKSCLIYPYICTKYTLSLQRIICFESKIKEESMPLEKMKMLHELNGKINNFAEKPEKIDNLMCLTNLDKETNV